MLKEGDKVHFGRTHGEKTLGEVIKVNGKSVKVRQLESRGTMNDHKVGTVWRVHLTLVTPVAGGSAPSVGAPASVGVPSLLTLTTYKKGDRVAFTGRRGRVITGTVERFNQKTVTIVDPSDGTRGYRVPPRMLRLATASDPGTPEVPDFADVLVAAPRF